MQCFASQILPQGFPTAFGHLDSILKHSRSKFYLIAYRRSEAADARSNCIFSRGVFQ